MLTLWVTVLALKSVSETLSLSASASVLETLTVLE
jgi:hypothetical protein